MNSTALYDLSKASPQEIEGLKQACLEISNKVLNTLEESDNPRAAFRPAVIFECDHWMDSIGEPAIDGKYTYTMRAKFQAVVFDALKGAIFDKLEKMS